jgi:ATP-dependent DNA helicase RecG
VDTLPASKDLRALCLAGILEMKGKSTATYYEPSLTFKKADSDSHLMLQGAVTPSQEATTPLQGTGTPSQGTGTPSQGTGTPLQRTELPFIIDERYRPLVAGVFADLDADTVSKIDRVRASVRAKSADVRDVIIKLCAMHPLTTLQLSLILGKSSSLLLTHYLTPLVNSGKLRYSIPEITFHPKQAYITV